MRIQLLICGMNREQYLHRVRVAWQKRHPDLFSERIEFHDVDGLGMAEAIQQAWIACLEREWDYILHTEEDMLPLDSVPLLRPVQVLERNPRIASMVYKRLPWWGSPTEVETGDVLQAIMQHATASEQHRGWVSHNHIFSLNPCLIPRRVVEMGWPAGPLGTGNESGMTSKLLADGYQFGMWGRPGRPAFFEHLGYERAANWAL